MPNLCNSCAQAGYCMFQFVFVFAFPTVSSENQSDPYLCEREAISTHIFPSQAQKGSLAKTQS